MRGVQERPAGLTYVPEVLSASEEAALLGQLGAWEFEEIRLHGQAARRTARHFGVRYDVERRQVGPGDPLPPELLDLRHRAAAVAEVPPEELVEALVLRYPPGAGIGWHRDAPHFGSPVVGVSLGAPCPLRFQRRVGGVRQVFELEVAPRSVYVLGGAARWSWQHHIPAAPDLRHSVTFRRLREAAP